MILQRVLLYHDINGTQRFMFLPKHRLVPVRLFGSCHVFTSKFTADHSMIVMFNPSSSEVDIIKARGISCLIRETKRKTGEEVEDSILQSCVVKNCITANNVGVANNFTFINVANNLISRLSFNPNLL